MYALPRGKVVSPLASHKTEAKWRRKRSFQRFQQHNFQDDIIQIRKPDHSLNVDGDTVRLRY